MGRRQEPASFYWLLSQIVARMKARCPIRDFRFDLSSRPTGGARRTEQMTSYVLTVTCKSTRGIVAAIANYLADQGCNIIDSSQFDDLDTGMFFTRVSFISEEGVGLAALKEGFKPVAEKFDMDAELHDGDSRMKVLLMVSRFGHCLND